MKNDQNIANGTKKLLTWIVVPGFLQYILTSLHHIYGAWVYNTPWRIHIIFIGLPFMILSILFLVLYKRSQKSLFLYISSGLSSLFFGILIGVYEGGYNHLFKNLVFLLADKQTAVSLFPPPVYEPPGNAVFEITGILQFPVGWMIVWYQVKLFRHKRLKKA